MCKRQETRNAIMPNTFPKAIPFAVIGAGLCLAALVIAYLYANYRSDVAKHRETAIIRAETVLDGLGAGMRAQGRMGQHRPDRLLAILQELAQAPDILALELRLEDGDAITVNDHEDGVPNVEPGAILEGPGWLAAAARTSMRHFPRDVDPDDRPGRGMGGGRGLGQDAYRGTHELAVVIDTTNMRDAIARERAQFGVSVGLTLVAIGLGAGVIAARARQKQMETQLLVAAEQARQHERLAQLGAGLAHETKNPLGVVRGLAQSITEIAEDNAKTREMAASIVDEADRTVGQINFFLTLARPQEAQPKPLNLDEFFEQLMPLLETETAGTNVRLHYEPCDLTVEADENLLRRAMLNLVANAVRACGDEGNVHIRVLHEDGGATLSVSDDGEGIPPEDVPRVKEPYFSRSADGSGLGLPIVDQIARSHGWEMRIDSVPGEGTSVYLEGMRRIE